MISFYDKSMKLYNIAILVTIQKYDVCNHAKNVKSTLAEQTNKWNIINGHDK